MKILPFILVATASLTFSACSLTPRQRCEKWRADGEIFSRIERCQRCVRQLGDADVGAVRSCTFGIDTAKALQGL